MADEFIRHLLCATSFNGTDEPLFFYYIFFSGRRQINIDKRYFEFYNKIQEQRKKPVYREVSATMCLQGGVLG